MNQRIIEDLSKPNHWQKKTLQRSKIMIGTPLYGGSIMGNYLLSISSTMQWAAKIGVEINPQFIFGATYVHLARNMIANAFMKSDCTHLIFVDADQGWMASNFFELVLQEKDIVGGLYSKRRRNWKAVKAAALAGVPAEMLAHCSGEFPMHPLKGHDITLGLEPQMVLTLPTGFMCITRKPFEAFMQAHPDKQTTPGNPGHFGWEFFEAGVRTYEGSKGFDSEDNYFCKDMNLLGFPTWFCPWMLISHFGQELYDPCLPCSMGHYIHVPEVALNLKVVK
jgi:hypothetical protein